MLTFRKAEPSDIPPILLMVQKYWDQCASDYDVYDPDSIIGAILAGQMWVMDAYTYPVGVGWLYGQKDDLHITISLLVDPRYMKPCLKLNLISNLLDEAFRLGVGKIKAQPMSHQTTALKLLAKHGFRHLATQYKETKKHGIKTDVHLYELRRAHWYRLNPEREPIMEQVA